jgi:hypothetical protein
MVHVNLMVLAVVIKDSLVRIVLFLSAIMIAVIMEIANQENVNVQINGQESIVQKSLVHLSAVRKEYAKKEHVIVLINFLENFVKLKDVKIIAVEMVFAIKENVNVKRVGKKLIVQSEILSMESLKME